METASSSAACSLSDLGKRKRCDRGDEAPVFVQTLFALMSDADKSIVRWSEDGSKMVIADPARFAAEVCPAYFRHRNFSSFTRLLNMYQFHKVPGSSRESKVVRFAHAHFREGKPEELRLVHRKGARPEEDSRPRTGVESLVAKDVWARANAELDAASKRAAPEASATVSTWMRKVLDLERETKRLRAENDRSARRRGARAALAVLQAQNETIVGLRAGNAPAPPAPPVPAAPEVAAPWGPWSSRCSCDVPAPQRRPRAAAPPPPDAPAAGPGDDALAMFADPAFAAMRAGRRGAGAPDAP
ncbi:DNA binding protein [Aureococcus anophagefferens]|nr:DNA binding protein [Aureococcus anophagefferens]